MTDFTITVPGPPTGKGRPRFGNNRTYTDKPTQLAEAAVQRAWEQAGCPTTNGSIRLQVQMFVVRPKSHYKSNGELNAEGERNPHPSRKKPDVDNALKLVMDALNKRAWEDDVRIVEASVMRKWGPRPFTWIRAFELATHAEEGRA